MTLLSAAAPLCRPQSKALALCAFAVLAFLLLTPNPAHAQGWVVNFGPCDKNGGSIGAYDSNGDPYRQQMIDGVLTGSGTSSQSLPPNVIGGYLTIPSPNDWRQGGTYNYFWTDDDPPSVWAEAESRLYNPTSDSPPFDTSRGASTVHFALSAHYLWSTGWDDQDTGAPPNLATKPTPPASEQFLLQTSLLATASESYYANGYQPVPASDYQGLSASSSLQDDVFNESVGIVFPAQPSPLSGQVLSQSGGGKHLVKAGLQMINGKAVYTVTLSGTGSASVVGAIGNMGLDGLADARAYLNGSVNPINVRLVLPDPNVDPTLGMGPANQYVYSADTPDGYLYVPGAIQVVGGTHADAQMLLDNNLVDLKIETSPIPNTFVHQWAISGNTIYVNTPQDTNNPYPGYQFNHWIFKGLPASNSSFGNHNVNLYSQGTVLQTAKIQTFFSGNASNWPNSDGYTPNWYEYYQQVAPLPILYNPLLPSVGVCETNYIFNHDTKEYYITGHILAMGPKAAQYSPVPVFEVGPDGFIQVAGKVQIKGILSYLYVNGHEVAHADAFDQRVDVPYIDGTPPAGVIDSDGDGIPDAWEIAHHLDPTDPDTAGYYTLTGGVDNGKGDAESLATMKGLGIMIKSANLWQQDWADLGIQYGKRPAYVPFEYDPLETFQVPSDSLSPNVLTDWP